MMKKRLEMRGRFSIFILLLLLVSCGDENYTPRPKGYFRLDLPEKVYTQLQIDCPYTFEINKNAQWVDKRGCWGDIYYPSIKARLQLTYKPVEDNLDTLLRDGQELAFKHTIKADGIEERLFVNKEDRIYGVLYKIKGDAATSTQFYMTDSTNNYLRGVLYFYVSPNADSLKPVNDFMYDETVHLIETLKWQSL